MTAFAMSLAVALLAVLTGSATAVRAVSRLWLRHWIEHRAGGAAAMSRYLDRPMRLVHAAGTAAMLVVFATGALIAMADGIRTWDFVRDVAVFLVSVLIVGQLLPRAIARRWAPQLVPIVVPFLRLVDLVLLPFHALGAFVARAVRRRPVRGEADELKEGLEELLRDGTFSDMGTTEEMAIISGVVQFGDKTVGDVMTPRRDLFMLDETLPAGDLAQQVASSGYSRVPVYRGQSDVIAGMVHVFDVFRGRGESRPPLRPVARTTPDTPAKDLLFGLLRTRRQLAIVQDGPAVVGLVTLEDLLEELVGDIRDEHDDSTD